MAGYEKAVFFITEVDVVNRGGGSHSLLHPSAPTVVSAPQKPVITSDPTAFSIKKKHRVQVLVS
jgi:hypothetical protein